MKVLLTGGSGFIGSHVAEQLAARGDTVRCLVRKSSNKKFLEGLGPNVEFAFGAVDDAASLVDAVKGVDAVVHSAGLVKARTEAEYAAVNHQGTENLLAALAEHNPRVSRFVHVGTAGIMGVCPSPEHMHRRNDEPKPMTPYARSKLLAENAVRAYKDRFPVTILRPGPVYGPRDTENLPIYKMVKNRVAVRLGLQHGCSWVYGPECAEAVVRAVTANVPSGEAYFLVDRKPMTIDEIAEAVAEAVGVKIAMRFGVPYFVLAAAAAGSSAYASMFRQTVKFNLDFLPELTMPRFVCDASETYEALGWDPKVEFPEGAKRTAEWYRSQKML